MESTVLKAFISERLANLKKIFLNDFAELSEGQRSLSPGGTARTANDMAFEIAYFNRRLAKRIRNEEVEVYPYEGWIKAPAGYAGADLESSFDDLMQAWEQLPPEDLLREIPLATEISNPLDLIFMAIMHGGYHDGQLNYIQTLHGDSAPHWQ